MAVNFNKSNKKNNSQISALKNETVKNNSVRLLSDKTPFGIKEAYNMARTNVMYLNNTNKCSVYGITSALPNEGKSLSASNLSVSFAKLGKNILLIDCDMRNSSQNLTFSTKNKTGLSEYLSGIKPEPVIQKTKQDNLDIIVAGKIPPNPSELLNNDRMKDLIDMMKERYDYIFLDFPPINIVSDATAAAEYIDGYIFVVQSGESDVRFVNSAINTLTNIGAKISGFILNGVNPKKGLKHSRYGKSKYGYYGDGYTGYGYGEYGEN